MVFHERSADDAMDCELFSDDEPDLEHRVPKPSCQPEYFVELQGFVAGVN